MARFNFTDDGIARLERPAQGRAYHYDQGGRASEKGLGVAVTRTGTATYFWHGRYSGKPIRVTLGRHGDITVAEARQLAQDARRAVRDGVNPRAAVSPRGLAKIDEPTVGDLWDIYVDKHLSKSVKNAEWAAAYWRELAAPLLPVYADRLTALEVKSWHNAVAAERGRPTANKALGRLRSMFTKAQVWRRQDGLPYASSNPASATAVPRFIERSRDRYLKPAELPPFLEAVADHDLADCRHLVQILLFTAARRGAVQAMRWQDIDIANRIWLIPREFMKGGRADHPVPLVKQALRVLEVRKEFAGRNDWVFPGRRRGKHITTVEGWFDELRQASGVTDIVPHDLRRTLASYMAMTGASLPIIAQMLGHSLPGVTSIYARLSVEPVREAAQTAVDHIMEVAGFDSA